ncbi:hypothetical protein SDC9_63491 [bioreactor metagenome]|uniref:Uncharacterized protein n=1 Tax=bioreactor metagenome TaxID=1076179 RepID=A0A644XLM6_9ZZZZ
MALPFARSAMIRFLMYSIAPTSNPRVGWATTRTFGERDISLATMTFCWFPPERLPALVFAPSALRISNCVMRFSASWFIASKSKMPKRLRYVSR